MSREIRNIINVVLAAIPLAMGIAVVVLTITNTDVSTNDLIRMLGFAAISLGILALNKNNKGGKE
jgi:hypothetical protein